MKIILIYLLTDSDAVTYKFSYYELYNLVTGHITCYITSRICNVEHLITLASCCIQLYNIDDISK